MVVNCWFCNHDTHVPYGNRNCWDCPHCEQYNGFQENGDYNKPIPAQYLEHLNHVVSSMPSPHDPAQPQQWVSSQVLLCRKCNHHQTTKIKQLAAFTPREEGKYDEEIEVYRHHLEQMYKLCRPCQVAVEYYIKHQNRQLRALLLSHQFRRREADQAQSFSSSVVKAPVQVILLRALAFLACTFLLTTALYGPSNPFTLGVALPPALPPGTNSSAAPDNSTAPGTKGWQQLLDLLPEHTAETLLEAWAFGQSHQMGIVAMGLLTCLLAMLLAGRIRLRRIDAFSACLWALLLGLHLAEQYLQVASPGWLDTLKLSAMSLCCLVGFTATVATRKVTGPRRFRPRRDSTALGPCLALPESKDEPATVFSTLGRAGSPAAAPQEDSALPHAEPRRSTGQGREQYGGCVTPGPCPWPGLSLATLQQLVEGALRFSEVPHSPPGLCLPSPLSPSVTGSSPALFVPTPPGFLPLTNQQLFRPPRRASPSSLPGRLSRALSLGTIPSLTRADSGYLFSGSRPPSRASRPQEVPLSDYFSLLSGRHLSSPLPSPAPSVASSVASSYGSLRHRRPLISPARLNLKGQKLLLFPATPGELPSTPSSSEEHSPHSGNLFTPGPPLPPTRQPVPDRDTMHSADVRGSRSIKKEDDASQSSMCVVDTTTRGCSEEAAAWKGRLGPSLTQGLLAVSLAANAVFTSAYLYQSLR
ncbi:Transmembrane protein 201 [Heterocephalus glaber]|uniref:Transmembrane protein 201 n=1 Tax=Heterocephalus glaber TaxID=10181 RepID=G5C539_HETGA|nr:Transmembrane protein 201 [Heterocephalus glaber]